jgi:hypothetical protein
METASGKETIILRRLIAYSEKIFQLSKGIVTLVSDRREKPRISTAAVVKSSLVLFWARLGSSNAWEQVGRARLAALARGVGLQRSSSNGVADPLSPPKTNANYPADPAPGQKRFHAALNLLNSHFSQPRCGIVARRQRQVQYRL